MNGNRPKTPLGARRAVSACNLRHGRADAVEGRFCPVPTHGVGTPYPPGGSLRPTGEVFNVYSVPTIEIKWPTGT